MSKAENTLQKWAVIAGGFGVAAFAFVAITGSMGAGAVIAPGGNTPGATAPTQVSGGGCSSDGLTNVQFKATYFDVGTGVDTQVNTTVKLFKKGETTPAASSSTGTSGQVTIASINCNTPDVVAYIGDDGATYYTEMKTFTALNAANTENSVVVKKASAATITFSNGVTFGQTTTTVSGVGSGGSNSDVSMKVKAGQYYYGNGAQEVCAVFTTTNITKVSLTYGATNLPEIASDPSISLGANKQIKCYELVGDLNNYAAKDLNVVIQAKTGVTPSNTTIDMYVNDKATYLKGSTLMTGYWNADTLADIGLAKVSQSAAITVN